MSKIELTHIDKYYGKNHVLKDLNLTIEDGDFMTLLGPSGCGKTTTLRVVSGLEKPQNGIILMDGKEIGLLSVAEEKIFADADTQRVRNGGAGLHGLGRLVLHPAVRDVELVQKGEALQNFFGALGGGGGVNLRNGHGQSSVSLSSFSPAR